MTTYNDSHRRLSALDEAEKRFVTEQVKAQVTPSKILEGLHLMTPDKPRPIKRQIYNLAYKVRSEERGNRNPAQEMLRLASKNGYVHFWEANDDSTELTHIFMAHPGALMLLRAYPYVIIIDSTYKTNLYKMPMVEIVGVTPVGKSFLIAYAFVTHEDKEGYTWVLGKLRQMLGGVTPNAIVTDREQGLLEAVSLVFPESSHLLCVWHIDIAVEKYALELLKTEWMAKAISSKWWHKVRTANTVEEHERRWANLCNKWGGMVGYLTRTWMIHVDKWASCYTNHIMHFGNTATSRVESAHSVVKNWLNSVTLTLDSIWTRVHAHIGQQHVEIRKHLENSRSTTLAVAQARLFSLLDGKVSHKAIKLMAEEFTRGTKLGMGLDIGCGCSMVSTHGLLCACQLHRLYQEDRPVHLDDVHVFWRTLRFDDVNSVPANDDVQLKCLTLRFTLIINVTLFTHMQLVS
ncbi:hypothetical protein RND81_06G195300 [Saponaria officinalis]|uniref:MULE transposase domain-containing protein n=1 Tax=Saponaria officinalis TaxID=3572 RepID=A0AAW1K8A0_SAPOF